MWTQVNQKLSQYLKTYKNRQLILKDELTDILNPLLEIDEIDNLTDVNKFKRFIQKQKIEEGTYLSWLRQKYLKRARITHKEAIEFLVMLAYLRFYSDLRAEKLFNDIIGIGYKQGLEELKTTPKGKLDTIVIMSTPNHLGWIWSEFVENDIDYNSRQVMKEYLVSLSQKRDIDLDELLRKQQRSHLNINKDKYSGSVEIHSNFVFNQGKLEAGKEVEGLKIRFIGIEDSRQTKMCHSLHGKEFFLSSWNEYERYSQKANGVVKMRTFGLVAGLNFPPIVDNFHYCRSTISYQV